MPLYRSRQTITAFRWDWPCPIPQWLHAAGFKQRKISKVMVGEIGGRRVRVGDYVTTDLQIYRPEEFEAAFEEIEE